MTNPHAGPTPGTYWVRPGRLLAGPYPHNRRILTPHSTLDLLLAAGVTQFVNLTESFELDHYDPALPVGIAHARYPIVDMDTPTPATLCTILDAIDAALTAEQTVYVHCWGGIGRTGTVIGSWLVRHGMEGQAALDEIVRLRGGKTDSPQTPAQFAMVLNWQDCHPDR